MFAVEKLAVSSCSRQWYVIQLSFLFLLHVTLTASYVLGPHHDYFKRAQGGNPCPDPEKPFPCKSSLTCIPMAYVCDQNEDCEDAYDENPDVCTAVKRPPVEDILAFLQSEEWMVENMFAGKSLPRVAHGLAVSQTLRDLQRRLDLSPTQEYNVKVALNAVKNGRQDLLEAIGMPRSSWKDVSFMFTKLIASGFTA